MRNRIPHQVIPKGVSLTFSVPFKQQHTATSIFPLYNLINHHFLVWSSCSVWISTHRGRDQHLKKELLSSQKGWQDKETQGPASAAATLASGHNLPCLKQPQSSEKTNKSLPSSWTAAASHCGESLVVPDITLVPKAPVMMGCRAWNSSPSRQHLVLIRGRSSPYAAQ